MGKVFAFDLKALPLNVWESKPKAIEEYASWWKWPKGVMMKRINIYCLRGTCRRRVVREQFSRVWMGYRNLEERWLIVTSSANAVRCLRGSIGWSGYAIKQLDIVLLVQNCRGSCGGCEHDYCTKDLQPSACQEWKRVSISKRYLIISPAVAGSRAH